MRYSEAGVRKASREETAVGFAPAVCRSMGDLIPAYALGFEKQRQLVITAALVLVAVCRIGTLVF
jgi:hypothetical protein